jgi:hypothetical protein
LAKQKQTSKLLPPKEPSNINSIAPMSKESKENGEDLNLRRLKVFENVESDCSDDEGDWEQEAILAVNSDSGRTRKPHPFFKNYKGLLNDLVLCKSVKTMWFIINMAISFDSKVAITITMKNDRTYFIKMYSLESKEIVFEEMIGGGEKNYIKCKEIVQNDNATLFATSYIDDGKFFVRYMAKTEKVRSPELIKSSTLDINSLLKLDDWTMIIDGFAEPFVSCCFVGLDTLFVFLFYTPKKTHYHFLYNTKTNQMVGSPVEITLDCNAKNFPVKCFYNDDKDEIYAFYRQG